MKLFNSKKNIRRAYIGLSTPIFFDYGHPASSTFNDLASSPNSIIETPYALFFLYDELWFLCQSLCPENMRNLDYVYFIDKDISLRKRVSNIERNKIFSLKEIEFGHQEVYNSFHKMNLDESYKIDSHTHQLKIFGSTYYSRSDYANLNFDLLVVKELNDLSLELVTNSITSQMLCSVKDFKSPLKGQLELTERIIIKNIPNFISEYGPYVDCIEDARSDSYLKDFRKWILSFDNKVSEKEVDEIVADVNNSIERMTNDLFLKYLEKSKVFKNTTKSILTFAFETAGGPIVPFAKLLGEIQEGIDLKNIKYQGFIVSSKNYFND